MVILPVTAHAHILETGPAALGLVVPGLGLVQDWWSSTPEDCRVIGVYRWKG